MAARGSSMLPAPSPEVVERCIAELDPVDVPLFGMAINGTPLVEIAAVAGADVPVIRTRVRALIGRLQATTPPAVR
jgi:hypothetical protein